MKSEQQEKLRTLFEAARKVGRELLVEIIASKNGPLTDDTIPTALEELYALGIKPDWWKLEPQASSAAWRKIDAVIAKNDPLCRGIVLLGLEAPAEELLAASKQRLPRRRSRALPWAGRSLPMPRAPGWRDKWTTKRRSPTWPGASGN